MASNVEDSKLEREIVTALRDVSERLATIRAQVADDMARLLAAYREDTHRTTMGIHARLLSYEDELVRDRVIRERRQAEVDAVLGAIRSNQTWRMRIEMGLIVVGLLTLVWFL